VSSPKHQRRQLADSRVVSTSKENTRRLLREDLWQFRGRGKAKIRGVGQVPAAKSWNAVDSWGETLLFLNWGRELCVYVESRQSLPIRSWSSGDAPSIFKARGGYSVYCDILGGDIWWILARAYGCEGWLPAVATYWFGGKTKKRKKKTGPLTKYRRRGVCSQLERGERAGLQKVLRNPPKQEKLLRLAGKRGRAFNLPQRERRA